MKIINKTHIICLIVLIILFLIGYFLIGNKTNELDESLVRCISNNSIIYISNDCAHCEKQEKLFGENFKELNVVDCILESEKCREANIIGVPTWIINNKKYEGVQSLNRLEELTKC